MEPTPIRIAATALAIGFIFVALLAPVPSYLQIVAIALAFVWAILEFRAKGRRD